MGIEYNPRKKFVRDNSKDTNEPQPSVSTFTYSKDTCEYEQLYSSACRRIPKLAHIGW